MNTTRRDFLASAVTAAGATVVPEHAHAEDHVHQDLPSDPALRVKSLDRPGGAAWAQASLDRCISAYPARPACRSGRFHRRHAFDTREGRQRARLSRSTSLFHRPKDSIQVGVGTSMSEKTGSTERRRLLASGLFLLARHALGATNTSPVPDPRDNARVDYGNRCAASDLQ